MLVLALGNNRMPVQALGNNFRMPVPALGNNFRAYACASLGEQPYVCASLGEQSVCLC